MQLSFFGEPEARPTWQYHTGLPDRSGLAKYTHLIMWAGDPEETLGRGFGRNVDRKSNGKPAGRKPDHWKHTFSVDVYKQKIMELMKDGEPRTFNCICVQITGTNAHVWFEKEPDLALWSLVEEGRLCWACELGTTFFLDSSFVEFA